MDKKQIIEDYLQGRHPMEQHSWEMPSAQELDNAEAEFDRRSLTPRPLRKERGLKFWPLAIAACLAGFVVIFLAPPRMADEPIASSQEPRVESQETIDNRQQTTVNRQQTTVKAEQLTACSQEPKAKSQRPKAKSQRPTAKSQQPIEEPMQAEAEAVGRGALPEMEDPFLAIAEQMQDIRSRGEQVRQVVAQLIDNKVNLQ